MSRSCRRCYQEEALKKHAGKKKERNRSRSGCGHQGEGKRARRCQVDRTKNSRATCQADRARFQPCPTSRTKKDHTEGRSLAVTKCDDGSRDPSPVRCPMTRHPEGSRRRARSARACFKATRNGGPRRWKAVREESNMWVLAYMTSTKAWRLRAEVLLCVCRATTPAQPVSDRQSAEEGRLCPALRGHATPSGLRLLLLIDATAHDTKTVTSGSDRFCAS